MDKANLKLMNIISKKFGGEFIRIRQRLNWKSPEGKVYFASPIFLRRTASLPAPILKEVIIEQEKETRTEVAQISAEVRTESIRVVESKAKKTSGKKKTIVKVADAAESRKEELKEE
jgi:hypothetical protein